MTWAVILVLVLGIGITIQELRWWRLHIAGAALETAADLFLRSVPKILLGPVLSFAGFLLLHSSEGNFWPAILEITSENRMQIIARPLMETGISLLVAGTWVWSTPPGQLLPAAVSRLLQGLAHLTLGVAWVAAAGLVLTHLAPPWWCDVAGALLLILAFAEIRDGVVHSDSFLSVGGSGGDDWWISLNFWQGSVDLENRPFFYIFNVLLTLGLAALFGAVAWS